VDKLRCKPGKTARFQRLHRNGAGRARFAQADEFPFDIFNEVAIFRAAAGESAESLRADYPDFAPLDKAYYLTCEDDFPKIYIYVRNRYPAFVLPQAA